MKGRCLEGKELLSRDIEYGISGRSVVVWGRKDEGTEGGEGRSGEGKAGAGERRGEEGRRPEKVKDSKKTNQKIASTPPPSPKKSRDVLLHHT